MARLKVGDQIEILRSGESERYVGRTGIIEVDDKTQCPFKIRLPNGDWTWCREDQVRLVTSSPAHGKPVTSFESGKWYQWVGPKKRRPRWNGNFDGTGDGQMDFILDGLPHLCSYGRGKGAKFPDSPDPDHEWNWDDGFEYFREVPSPSQGHEHSVGVWAQTPRILHDSRPMAIRLSLDPDKLRSFTSPIIGKPYNAKRSPISTRSDIRRRLLNLE